MIRELYLKIQRLDALGGPPWNDKLLEDIANSLDQLSSNAEFEIQKISELKKHIKPQMSARTLNDLMIPIERYLKKEILESDFLVTKMDSPERIRKTYPLILVLENFRSSFNVGSLLRTAEALGVEKVYLSGYTANPTNVGVKKTALGSAEHIQWESVPDSIELISRLKENSYRVVGLETTAKAQSISRNFLVQPTAFVFGNERFGINADTLAACDELRQIPLVGVKNSLNVSVCAGIVCFEWLRQWPQK